ncbi:Retrovirus-related Pol polyprotein from type-2 retrotransposable element R2DM [Dictyocoela muelleri]|nr:Retrovirus-related Pol polyprotein from type-2 retrotransposable element R2DM [Dictyocoela muelleri]
MGSVSKKNALENRKRKKMKTGDDSLTKTNTIPSNLKNTHHSKRIFDDDYLIELLSEYKGESERMKRGGWPKLTAKYNLKNNTDFNQNQIRNYYLTHLKEKIHIKNEINNKNKEIESKDVKMIENQEDIKNDEKQNRKNCTTVSDIPIQLNKTLKISEYNQEIFECIKTIVAELKIENIIYWEYTPKISSLTLKRKLLQAIDESVLILIHEIGINSIDDIIKIIYACQLCYHKMSKTKINTNNWINNINNKINERILEKSILEKRINNINLTEDDKKLFKRIINKRKTISSDKSKTITNDDMNKIIFDLDNEISLYKKRLDVHFKKKEYLKTNFIFECNRKCFYRSLDSDKNEQKTTPNTEKLIEFWKSQFQKVSNNNETELSCLLDKTIFPIKTEPIMDLRNETIDNIINNLPSWKAPGVDKIYNFFIKNIKSIRPYLISEIIKLCNEPSKIPPYMFKTITHMIPKKENPDVQDYRPISCLSNIYKIITRVFSYNLTTILEMNNSISFNQLGGRKNCLAAKEQLIFNHCINIYNDYKLKILWVDITKAFDSVPFKYINNILSRLNLPRNFIELIKNSQSNLEINITQNRNIIGSFKPRRGILQGDSLSPLLFTLCMEPISRVLNERDDLKLKMNYNNKELQINHLFYMDDLKILAENDTNLCLLTKKLEETLNTIGMEHNKNKSSTNSIICKNYADVISPIDGYKYLGLIEDVDSRFKNINVDMMLEKIKQRIRKLCNTKLTGKNLFTAINEFAISLLNYYVGVVNIPEDTLVKQDKEIRNILREFKCHYKTASKERLYLKRKYNGRGLDNLEFSYEKMLYTLVSKIEEQSTISNRMEFIKYIYQNFLISKSELDENLRNKYNMAENENFNKSSLNNVFQMKLINELKNKGKHGKMFIDDGNFLKVTDSSIWLRRGKLDPKTEANLCNIQDRNVFYNTEKCPHCKITNISVDHLATRCEKMLHYNYKRRHDEIIKVIVICILNKISKNPIKHIKYIKQKNVYDKKEYKICVDIPIRTDTLIRDNKPDIVFFNYNKKEIYFIEVGITNRDILMQTESWKKRKYELLAKEYGRMTGMKVYILPFVMSWDGYVSDFNRQYREKIGINFETFGYIQSLCLNKTFECVVHNKYENDVQENNSLKITELSM